MSKPHVAPSAYVGALLAVLGSLPCWALLWWLGSAVAGLWRR